MNNLLSRARREILDLRSQNELLQSQMAVVEVFAAALGLRKNPSPQTPDITWELSLKIKELETPVPTE